jgi:hypothetical protein
MRATYINKESNLNELNLPNHTYKNNNTFRINRNLEDYQSITNEKLKKMQNLGSNNHLKISYLNIMIPFNVCRSKKLKSKYEKYSMLKDYIFNQLSIKEILISADELDKLKFYLLESHEIGAFEKLERPLVKKYGVKSIWLSSEIYNI